MGDYFETPPLDNRLYGVIILRNQLEVFLGHDPDTDKASAAMDVNVGNFSDPDDLPGLAHCVEHMLFTGTKKYPEENGYHQYISMHSGKFNAQTSSTSTKFHFEVAAKPVSPEEVSPLYGALERFAEFFTDPLFLSSALDRELIAVDSENKKNLQNDIWRLRQLRRSLSNPKHPYCHFGTGNLETLKSLPEARGVNVRQEVMNFYEKHYSANRMKLAVIGREPLDVLQEWVSALFDGVKNKDLPQNRWEDEQPLGENELLTQHFANPIEESHLLGLYFPSMNQENLFESQPSRYINHLIGHEGPGSVMSYIKSKGWANSLTAGTDVLCPGSLGMFICQIGLTKEGLEHYHEIIKVFFQYISLLMEASPQEWIFNELKDMADVEFKFQQKTPVSEFTRKISALMQTPLPREWLLSGYSRLRVFDAAAITTALEYLRPDNFRLSIVSQSFQGHWDKIEKWYGTEYKYEKIPEDFLTEIRKASASPKDRLPELHLPHKNMFIPTKLEVEKKDVKEQAVAPRLIRSDNLVRSWFKKDDTFWVPKANLFIHCKNPLLSATAENFLKAKVYTVLVRDVIEEFLYNAELAGLEYSVSPRSTGLDIKLSGYNEKLSVLLELVLTTMRGLKIKPGHFEIIKESLREDMRNWDYQRPYGQVGNFTEWLNSERGFINDQLITELPRISAEDVQSYYPQLLQQMHIEILIHGNVSEEDALSLVNLVESIFRPHPLPRNQWPVARSLIFPPGGNFLYRRTLKDAKNVNHCIDYFLYIGSEASRPLRARALLLGQMMNEPAFDQLRIKEQLGYVVLRGVQVNATTIGYRIAIQSERTPEYLDTRIDAFLSGYIKTMHKMSETDFYKHKRSVITNLLEKLKNLDQESSRLWGHIENGCFDFERTHYDVAHIEALMKSSVIEFFEHYISPASSTRSKLAVYLHAQGNVSEVPAAGKALGVVKEAELQPEAPNKQQPCIIDNVNDFKSLLEVTERPQPVRDLSEFEVV